MLDGLQRSVGKCIAALRGTKTVDLFGPARLDSDVTVEDTVRTLAGMVREGSLVCPNVCGVPSWGTRYVGTL
ncbi:hypothetical protein GY45DRAFT_1065548 [Cubamyces sp. BRFM 1775]|nr:hypothetical protein GY45DRAFT_1065548 [Cubamyces sp. BRFM 1775]